jgi:hypothetical protein
LEEQEASIQLAIQPASLTPSPSKLAPCQFEYGISASFLILIDNKIINYLLLAISSKGNGAFNWISNFCQYF